MASTGVALRCSARSAASRVLSLLLASLVTLPVQAQWKPVRIGGSGLVPGMFFPDASDSNGSVYIKTDVGGAYRRIASSGAPSGWAWEPLLDWLAADMSAYYSVSDLAPTPGNRNEVTALLGANLNWGPCMLARSSDAGSSWSILRAPASWSAPACGGNAPDRASGQRLSVHPSDSSIIAIAGYDGHVYITNDTFNTSYVVHLPGLTYPTSTPIRCIHFIDVEGQVMAIAAAPNGGMWVAQSEYTSNASWSYIASSNATLGDVQRLMYDGAGHLYFTRDGGFGRFVISSGNNISLEWSHSPADGYTYDGMALSDADPAGDVTFMSINLNSDTTLWRTRDGGSTWSSVNWTAASMLPWATANSYDLKLNSAAYIAYDPASRAASGNATVWVSDFFAAWVCTDWDAPQGGVVHFNSVVTGIEEMCINFIASPPVGFGMIGAADTFGWTFTQGWDTYPLSVWPTPDAHNCGFGASYTLAVSSNGSYPAAMWVTGGDEYGATRNGWSGTHHWVAYSTDGGLTFTETTYDASFANSNALPYRVQTDAWNAAVAVITGYMGMPVIYTHDAGVTWWNATTGDGELLLSVGPWGNFWWAQPFARDVNTPAGTPTPFYYYNGTTSLFTSTDSGVSWALTYSGFPTWNVPLFAIATPPRGTSAPGDIWAFAGWQLHHSVNGGANFSSVWQLYSLKSAIAVGPLPNATGSRTGMTALALSVACSANRARAAGTVEPHAPLADVAAEVQPYPTSTAAATYVVYAAGQAVYNEPWGIYASVDFGGTWVELTTPTQEVGDSPNVLEASLSSPGVLLVGTDGRGAMYVDATAPILDALEACVH